MKLSTSLVAVKKISCTTTRSIFLDEDIEKAANAILEIEGVINPIVVRRLNLQSYEVVNGDFEYYAATRAREINPKKGEMIGVYIIEDENEEILSKQVEIFRRQTSVVAKQVEITTETLEMFLKNIESRLDKLASQLLEESKEKYRLEYEVKELQRKIIKASEPLDIFNNLEQSKLFRKLSKVGIPEGTAIKIAEAVVEERKNKPFESLKHVVERVKMKVAKKTQKAIGTEKMLKIIDSWSSNDD
jgi:hypothetical protein